MTHPVAKEATKEAKQKAKIKAKAKGKAKAKEKQASRETGNPLVRARGNGTKSMANMEANGTKARERQAVDSQSKAKDMERRAKAKERASNANSAPDDEGSYLARMEVALELQQGSRTSLYVRP